MRPKSLVLYDATFQTKAMEVELEAFINREAAKGIRQHEIRWRDCEIICDVLESYRELTSRYHSPQSRIVEQMEGNLPSDRIRSIVRYLEGDRERIPDPTRTSFSKKTVIDFCAAVQNLRFGDPNLPSLARLIPKKSYARTKELLKELLVDLGVEGLSDAELDVVIDAGVDEMLDVGIRAKAQYGSAAELASRHDWKHLREGFQRIFDDARFLSQFGPSGASVGQCTGMAVDRIIQPVSRNSGLDSTSD